MKGRQLLLGLDTATPVTAVAVVESTDGRCRTLAAATHRDPRRHGEVLPTMLLGVLADAGLAPADLSGIAVGVGPGAYTGLRVGIATAQALGLACHVPVLGVFTLDAIAHATRMDEPFAVVTDARRREVYVSRYRDHRTRDGGPTVVDPDRLRAVLGGTRTVVVTSDTPDLTGLDVGDGRVVEGPTGVSVCEVVADRWHRGVATDPVRPVYLRRPDVTAAAAPKSVLP